MHISSDYVLSTEMGIINFRVEQDRFHNDVSLIAFPSYFFRMVHHSSRDHLNQKATIYAGRGRFVRFEAYKGHFNHEFKVAGYGLIWDCDGKLIYLEQNPDGPEITELQTVTNGDEARALLYIMSRIDPEEYPKIWQYKEVKPKKWS